MHANLKKLSDSELLVATKDIARHERETTTSVLWHLKEVSDRRLYCALGFGSIFKYTVEELQYSEGAAARRLSAMRLLSEIPEIAPAIENGTLNLSTVSTVQNFFKREKVDQGKEYTEEQKKDVLDSVSNKSKRETETILATLSPESVVGPEKTKPLTETKTELRIILDADTLNKIEKLRDLTAHQNPEGSYGVLLGILAEIALDKLDPVKKEERIQKRQTKARKVAEGKRDVEAKAESELTAQAEAHAATIQGTPPEELSQKNKSTPRAKPTPQNKSTPSGESVSLNKATPMEDLSPQNKSTPPAKSGGMAKRNLCKNVNFRYIPAKIRREVSIRDGGRCTFQDARTGRVCGDTYKIEVDHIVPVAAGGKSELNNLRLVCFHHNQWAAIQKLGKSAMAPFIRVV